MQSQSIKSILTGFLIFICVINLGAEPVQILDVNASNFPRIQLKVAISSPHPNFIKDELKNELEIFELYNDQENESKIIQKNFLSNDASRLNLVIVLDATKSISKKSFQQSQKMARQLLQTLGKNDRSAIYVLKGKPVLLADVSSNHNTQAHKIDIIEHDGKKTRLYDSLYSSLYTARSMGVQDSNDIQSKTAVILFSDGHDEGSYLTDNDCFELTEIGRNLSIPVYTVLSYANKTKKSDLKTIESNFDLLKRLSLKTGGFSWIFNGNHIPKKYIEEIHSNKHQVYQLSYISQASEAGLYPGSTVMIRMVAQRGESSWSAISKYRISLLAWLKHNMGRSVSIIAGVILVLLVLFILLVFFFILLTFYMKNTKESRHKGIAKDDQEVIPDFVPYLDKPDLCEAPGTSKPNRMENQVEENIRQSQLIAANSFAANALMDDERKLYMREYNYRLLQMGLREAGEYKKAALIAQKPEKVGGSRQYDLFLESTAIGSGRWANIPVHDNTISPIHAKLKRINNQYVIYDMLSAGGVYLNGKKILRPHGLKDNDEIRIGRSKFYFQSTE